MVAIFCKKVPPTSLSPTFKLTLPSEGAAVHLGQFINSDFQLREAKSNLSWPVSITKRRNKDKYEYLLMGWKNVCQHIDVHCGDYLQFRVFDDHVEFVHSRTPPNIEDPPPPSSEATQTDRSLASSADVLKFSDRSDNIPDENTALSNEEANPGFNLEQPSDAQNVLPAASYGHETNPSLMTDSLFDLMLDIDLDALEENPLHLPTTCAMEAMHPYKEEPIAPEASLQWSETPTTVSPSYLQEKRECSAIRSSAWKRKAETELASPREWRKVKAGGKGRLPRNSSSSHSDQGFYGASERGPMSFESSSSYPSGIRFYTGRGSNLELDNLRAALREQREKTARAEICNAKLTRMLNGAEGILERQTSRGLRHAGAIFAAANRLFSREMAQQVGMPAANRLGTTQVELKQLAHELLDALWQMRGLTRQKDIPAGYGAAFTLSPPRQECRKEGMVTGHMSRRAHGDMI